MKHHLAITLLFTALLCGAPMATAEPDKPSEPTPPGVAAADVAQWKLTFSDEFNGTALDETKWSYRFLGPRESSIIAKDCISLDGEGHLHVSVKEKDGVLQNGMIGTQKKFEAKFGIFAARIKFPRQQGQHGSFWMQPAKPEKVTDNPALSGAEIDVIEWFGADRKDGGTASNIYWPGPKGPKEHHAGGTKDFHALLKGKNAEWSDDWHVFSLEWSDKQYTFRIDDDVTYVIAEGVSQTPQYLILSLFTADWEKDRLDRGKLPDSMEVDWVRVWQKDGTQTQEKR